MADIAGSQLIGRRSDLAIFDETFSNDDIRILEISGEPGIGKTRLLEAYADAARREGVRWRAGRAQASDLDVPFAVFVEALDDGLTELVDVDQFVSAEEYDPALRQVFPALRQPHDRRAFTVPAPGLAGDGAVSAHLVHRAVRNLLEQAGRAAPIVIALDNVHAADPASVDLLVQLVRRPPRFGVTLVLAYRPRQLRVRLAAALLQAQRAGTSRKVELRPLDQAEAAVLLGAEASPATLESIHDLAGGNPLYLQALRDAHGLDLAELRGGEVGNIELPHAVAVSLLMEIDGLDELPRLVARAAAVSGDPIVPTLVAAAADIDIDAVLAALDELQQHDLVRPAEPAGALAFRHPLVRQAVYRALPAGWRQLAHHRLATELGQQGAAITRRAPHVQASAAPGDKDAIDLLDAAAEEVLGTAPAQAAQWSRAALDLIIVVDGRRRVGLLHRLGVALGMSGRHEGSRDAAIDLLRLLPAGDPRRAAAVKMFSAAGRSLGSGQDAVQLLLDELGRQPADSPRWADLKLELAHVDLARSQHGTARGHVRAIHRWAARHDDHRRLAHGSSMLAVTEALSGGIESARAELAAASTALESMPDLTAATDVELFVVLARGNIAVGQYLAAIERVRQGLCVVQTTGQEFARAPLLTLLSEAELRLGRLGLADAHAHAALEAALSSSTVQHRILALAQRSSVAATAGDLARASGLGREAVTLASKMADPHMLLAARALAVSWLLAGRAHQGTALLLETHGGDLMGKLDVLSRPHIYWALARGSRLSGDSSRAAEWAGRASECAARVDLPGARGHAHLAMAEATVDTDPALALEHARQAGAEFDSGGERLSVARSEHLAAVVYQTVGDEAGARAAAGRAHGIYLSCGAYPIAASSAELTSDAPVGGEDVAAAHPVDGPDPVEASWPDDQEGWLNRATLLNQPALHDLSRRQRQVAQLIAEGRSNRQIANILHVVERTVEAHVSQILRRLGVDSRAAVASWVTRETYKP